MHEHIEIFRTAIREAGLVPPEIIESDGKLHRFASNGERGDDAGWYVLHEDGIPAGAFGDWRSGVSMHWRADCGTKFSPEQGPRHRTRLAPIRNAREVEEDKRRTGAKERAAMFWLMAKPAPADHAYLLAKSVGPHGLRVYEGALVVPMRNGGELQSLQFIAGNGRKTFLSGGRTAGCSYSIGDTQGATALCIAEGFATGATIHEATGHPVAVAFSAGNLVAVAQAMRTQFSVLPLVICADDDADTAGNPGRTKALEAALAVCGLVAIPDFGPERQAGASDFNDLAMARGLNAVREAIQNAAVPDVTGQCMGLPDLPWPEPLPLVANIEPEPYPLDALPATIRAAVVEVQGFIKAPVSLVGSCALAALSLAIQAHADVKRADRLAGPASLFLLTIADSGERKSTCDGFFTGAIRAYEEAQAEIARAKLSEHKAAMETWEAKRGGIRDKIRQSAKDDKPTDDLAADLRHLEQAKPESPQIPRLIYTDATPEALAFGLARGWPSGGVISAESGSVLGAHGMGRESLMRNLALLNLLWDGGTLTIDRRTAESFTVRGARLTVALQVQETTLRSFFDRSGGLARGTGFLARFLLAWPESTQGSRHFTEAPANWPALAEFNRRIAKILERPAPIDEQGALDPPQIMLGEEAKAAWVSFHNVIEGELARGGELYDVRDVASKTAENAARLALLFQVFEYGVGEAVRLDCFEGASRLAAWHLSESRRFFGALDLPGHVADTVRLDTWLVAHCQRQQTQMVGKNHVRQHGPLRDGARLDGAIRELAELNRLRLDKLGTRLTIHLNPALLRSAS